MFPVESESIKSRILEEVAPAYLKDNVKARVLGADGTYRVGIKNGAAPYRVQEELLKLHLAMPPEKPAPSATGGKEETPAGKERPPRKRRGLSTNPFREQKDRPHAQATDSDAPRQELMENRCCR